MELNIEKIYKNAFADALEGRDQYSSLTEEEQKDYQKKAAYVYGFYKGLDAAKFLGVQNQHFLEKK